MNERLVSRLKEEVIGSRKYAEEKSVRQQRSLDFLESCKNEIPADCEVSLHYEGNLVFSLDGFEKLPIVRAFLRDELGSWTDEADAPREYRQNQAHVFYSNPTNKDIEIEVSFNISETPESFLKKGKCGWKTWISPAVEYQGFKCNLA